MPRFFRSILIALLAAVFTGLAVREYQRISVEPDIDFTGPGAFTFTAAAADHFTLWHNATASIDGIYSVRENRLPAGTEITITHAGVVIPAKVDGTNHVSGSETGDKTSVLTFQAPARGDYLITVTGLPVKHAFSISRGRGLMPFLRMIGWGLSAAFAGGLLVIFLLLDYTRNRPKPLPAPPVLKQET